MNNMKNERNYEQIFYNKVQNMIKNLLIDNPNYKNGYYTADGCESSHMKGDLLKETKEKAQYILEEMHAIKHLINL